MNSSRWRNLGIAVVACLVVIGLIAGALRPKRASGAGTGTPPDVMVAQVEQRDVPIYGEWIGTLDGFVNADVRAQVTGYLVRQDYKEGAFVNKGQLSLRLIPGPFRRLSTKPRDSLLKLRRSLPMPKLSKSAPSLMWNVTLRWRRSRRRASRISTTPLKTTSLRKPQWRRPKPRSRRRRLPSKRRGSTSILLA